jgi:arabinose-5-phosphate isomerase
MKHLARAQEVFAIEQAALAAVAARLGAEFDRAVDLLLPVLTVRAKIVVVGVGKSGNIGRKIAATLSSTGSTAVVLDSVDALHGDLGIVSEGDAVLALSYSGESEELIQLLPPLKRFSSVLIALTGNTQSSLAREATIVLNCQVPQEACRFNLAPTSSTTAMLAMGDALALALMDARGFTERDFAARHPAGAIGRSLWVRIRDIMRRGDRNAIAAATLPVRDALLVMTRAKSGSVGVVDLEGKLVGVFTDGDLRRRMSTDESVLSRPLSEVMTLRPITIDENALAVEALRIFHQRDIDDLIVVNSLQEPVGMVDSQDLPKLKLM